MLWIIWNGLSWWDCLWGGYRVYMEFSNNTTIKLWSSLVFKSDRGWEPLSFFLSLWKWIFRFWVSFFFYALWNSHEMWHLRLCRLHVKWGTEHEKCASLTTEQRLSTWEVLPEAFKAIVDILCFNYSNFKNKPQKQYADSNWLWAYYRVFLPFCSNLAAWELRRRCVEK